MRGAILGALVTALLAGAPIAASAQESIKIPAITPLTGPLAILGQDSAKGIELAVERINKGGGIAGRPLVVEAADGQNKPEIVRREMERLIKLQGAPMVLGCEGSAGTAVAAQFAEQSRVPLLNGTAVSADILKRGYKYYFSQQYTGDDEAQAVVKFLDSIGGAGVKVALLYEDSPRGAGTGEQLRKLFAEKGAPVIAEVSYNRAERNLLPFVKKIQEAAPDVVVWVGYTEDVVAGLKAVEQLQYKTYVLGVGGGPGDPRLPELANRGVISSLHLATVDNFNTDTKRSHQLVEAYRQKYNADPSSYVSLCYQTVLTLKSVLEAALKSGASLKPSDLQKALRTIVVPGDLTITPYDRIQFDEAGRNLGATPLVSQWKDNASRKSTVWPPTVAVAKPDPLR